MLDFPAELKYDFWIMFQIYLQPGLANVIGQTVGTDTSYFIHAPRGIHAMQNPSGVWSYASQDRLGSVRQDMDTLGMVLAIGDYQPFGTLKNVQGTFGLPFKFTGEQKTIMNCNTIATGT